MHIPDDIKVAVLRRLYLYEFLGEGKSQVGHIRDEAGWDEEAFDDTIEKMVRMGWIESRAAGGSYSIRLEGIREVEREGIVDDGLIETNFQIREDALLRLAEPKGKSFGQHFSQIFPDSPHPDILIVKNLGYLDRRGLVRHNDAGFFTSTDYGRDVAEKLSQWNDLTHDFEEAHDLEPRRRGRKFNPLFAQLLRLSGWEAEESVRSSHEEMDVIFSKGRDYFLVECKWTKKRAGSPVVRSVYGKVSNRAKVDGLIASMSGFTSEAIEAVQGYSGNKTILLFGPKDIDSLFHVRVQFDELLNKKIKAMNTDMTVLVE